MYASQPTQFLFFFQAGNLEFLGLNLAWSVDVLSVLVLTSMLGTSDGTRRAALQLSCCRKAGSHAFLFPWLPAAFN